MLHFPAVFIHVAPSTVEVLPFIPVKMKCLRTSAQQMLDSECDIMPLGAVQV